MDGIEDKLSEILSDPDSMQKIKALAEGIFSDRSSSQNSSTSTESESPHNSPPFSLPDGIDLTKLMGIMTVLNTKNDDSRAGLLLALKPHLSPERRDRVDKAVKFLKIASLLPVLREQGLLDII